MARAIDVDVLANKIMEIWDRAENEGRTDIANFIANIIVPCIVGTPTIEPKQEWISVKDRLPEVGQKVLVCDVGPDSDHGIRALSLECDEKGTYWDDGDGWWFEPEDMSHWMPLPEPPKEG